MKALTVIIPTRSLPKLNACAAAIASLDVCDVLAVWDKSKLNHSIEATDNYRVREVDLDFIYARNCNIGILCSSDHDVILMNDDALLTTPGGFREMQRVAEGHPEFGIVGAVTNVTGQPLQRPQGIGLREVPHFAFVCVFIPRRTIEAVGFLDTRYCLDYGVEDLDYCEMVKRAGLKCGVYDHCFVDHASMTSSFRGDPHASRSFSRNKALFNQKWGATV